MKDRVAIALALALPGAAALWVLVALHGWAAISFAQPPLASMLLAVVEIGVLLVALALTPALAKLIRRVLGA